jgi:hypothetical protein
MFIPKDLHDHKEYPDMVRWFSPVVLAKTVNKVIASTLFGQYADRRLIHASLDKIEGKEAVLARCGDGSTFCTDQDKTVWVDYVADLGDGFDSTYAVAYLIGRKGLALPGVGTLPRAQCLIMGGDQVYPDASRYDYEKRMQRPYRFAFPNSLAENAVHPPVFLIPGNHDWYDGLTLFLAKFCRGRPTSLGSWRAVQHRSYFAVQLADNWWLWGYDSQLGEDIDKPQADFFAEVARQMSPGAKVVLCASVPSWLEAELKTADPHNREMFYRGLDYVAGIIRNECPGAKVPLVLSGDLHHYSRYVASPCGTHFITAGGGGAFLHPTHQLPDTIHASWVTTAQTLTLAQTPVGSDHQLQDACYPPRDVSRKLAHGNWKFIARNPEFALTLGGVYWITALALLAWGGYGRAAGSDGYWTRVLEIAGGMISTPAILVVAALYLAALTHYADIQPKARKYMVGTVHAAVHVCLVIVCASLLSPFLAHLRVLPVGDILYFLGLGIGMVLPGFIGGFIWGLYLVAVSFSWGMHANDAFSAMRLGSYRHFLRLKINGDELTVYPIGIDKEPKRTGWKFNPDYREGDQDTPAIIPQDALGEHLVEPPIIINARDVQPLRALAR